MEYIKTYSSLALAVLISSLPAQAQNSMNVQHTIAENTHLIQSIDKQIKNDAPQGRLSLEKSMELRRELSSITATFKIGADQNEIYSRLQMLERKISRSPASEKNLPEVEWPPRDAAGKIILGPIRYGTREQLGAPLYGYSREEYIRRTGRGRRTIP